MEARRTKDLVLILSRELAANLATPMFITDAEGKLVFYNEAAERILGRRFVEAGELQASEWEGVFSVEGPDGEALPLEKMPAGIAFLEQRPAHGELRITGLDGTKRELSVTAFPLLKRGREFLGVVAIFWE
jgi:PAS domain-containing protein